MCVCVCGLWQQISSVFSCKKINNTLLNQITVPGAGIAANQDLICGHTFTESILSQDTDRGADVFTGQSVCYSQYKCTHTQAQTHTHTHSRGFLIFLSALVTTATGQSLSWGILWQLWTGHLREGWSGRHRQRAESEIWGGGKLSDTWRMNSIPWKLHHLFKRVASETWKQDRPH